MKKFTFTFAFLLIINTLSFSQTSTVVEILDKYFNAIGGRAKLEAVTDITLNTSVQIQGMTENVVAQKKNGKFLSIGSIEGMGEMEKWVCDGKNIQLSAMGQNRKLEGKMLQLMLSQSAAIFPELQYEKIGVTGKVEGIEKIDGRDAYKIQWTHEAGKWTDFFDVQTGLKVRQTAEIETPQGNVNTVNSYANYKTVDGIRIPHTITINNGMMDLTTAISKIEINKNLDDSLFEIK